ncbi:MAG: hypothetical protein KDC70_03395 [Saprospiraceae bacterium]|nr:hypothetical protein [Saprospiraceae bacterium]
MKRTFAKKSPMSLLAGFFLFGFLLLTAGRAEAQTYNWMQSDQAQQTIKQEVTTLQTSLQGLTPGTQSYNDVLIHAHYYKAIYRRIVGGMSVEQSVTKALDIFPDAANLSSDTAADSFTGFFVSKSTKESLSNEATGKLTL